MNDVLIPVHQLITKLQKENQKLTYALMDAKIFSEQFESFVDQLLDGASEGSSFDGDDIQNMAAAHGLLEEKTINEPCEQWCQCYQMEATFPVQCFWKTYK